MTTPASPAARPDRLADLADIESACWAELSRAAQQPAHAWRTMTLATADGDQPEARTVILREVQAQQRQLLFYTDDRSPKRHQIRRNPKGSLLMWSRPLGWQLRLRVHLAALDDGLAISSRWARLRLTPAAQDYLSPLAPGMVLDSAAPAPGARHHFAVVAAQVHAMDWLELHPQGHRRALFDADGARWVQP